MSEPRAGQEPGRPPPDLARAWSPTLRSHMLDPEAWQEGLERYARATHLAVALVDADGHLLGQCLNPRPTWRLLRAQLPPDAGACPFCLLPSPPRRCVAEALHTGQVRITRDRTGLVHAIVPLVLGDHAVGVLMAGQVFDHYPDSLVLEHAAVTCGLRPERVWQLARLEAPVTRAALRIYADLLATLGTTFLQTRYDARMLQQRTDELTAADRQKDAFLATLAHELHNPLAPIRNAVYLMQRQDVQNPEVHWGVDVIERQLQQLTRLVNDLLDLSRITRNTLELRPERLDLAEALAMAVETSRPLMEANGLDFVVTLPPEPITLDADPVRLAQVIANLLNNAAKYTPRGGRIWLTTERQGPEAVVTVRDTGIGVPAETLPRIFEMFTQGEPSPDRAPGGLGVGLTLARQIVERHGGTVTAHSAGPGHGSTFTVRLPALPEPSPARPPARQAPVGTAPVPSRRILIVDDERLSVISWGKLLQREGHAIRTAYDGREAVEVAEAFRPEVVLLDLGLPQLTGYEVADRIRHQPWGQDMVLIALTGWGHDADRQRSTAAGFDHHLVKPLDPSALLHLLASLP